MQQPNDVSKRSPYPVKLALTLGVCLLGGLVIYGAVMWLGARWQSPRSSYLTVCAVEADPYIPGRAYAQLGKARSGCSMGNPFAAEYQTDDYGQSWQLLADPPVEWNSWHALQQVPALSNYGGSVKYDGRIVWTLPRLDFERLFNASTNWMCDSCLAMSSVAPAGQGVLYVALGQYGVLVGPNPAENNNRPWHLVQSDFAGLDPRTFHITDPFSIMAIILVVLAIPPLPLIHGWLLAQAWRYMFPLDEQVAALRLAWRVSAGLTIVAALALAFWLFDADADFLAVVGTVTAITVVTGIAVGVRTARRRQFTDGFVWKMGIVTALLSLIVPVSVVATRLSGSANTGIGDLAWLICFLLIFGFIRYRRMLNKYLDRLDARATLWQVDRLALEILVLFLVMLLPLGAVTAGIAVLLRTTYPLICFGIPYLCLFSVFGVPALGASVLSIYTRRRGRGFVIKKKASPLELHDTPLFAGNSWFRMLFWQTVIWLSSTIIVSGLLVFAWYTSLSWASVFGY
ncbi:MAG: hypothetical protein ACYDBJ_01970 [Aggregatilineales bacterium]